MRLCLKSGCCNTLRASWPCEALSPCLLRLPLLFDDAERAKVPLSAARF